jgi:hypothetical protein
VKCELGAERCSLDPPRNPDARQKSHLQFSSPHAEVSKISRTPPCALFMYAASVHHWRGWPLTLEDCHKPDTSPSHCPPIQQCPSNRADPASPSTNTPKPSSASHPLPPNEPTHAQSAPTLPQYASAVALPKPALRWREKKGTSAVSGRKGLQMV